MPDGDPVNIPIQSTFAGEGFDAANSAAVSLGARLRELQGAEAAAGAPVTPTIAPLKGAEEVEDRLHALRDDAREFLDTLKLGVGIDLGERAVESIGELGRAFTEAVKEGVEFNAEVEGSINSFASTLQSVQPAIYQTRDAAKSAAADVFGQVRQYAIQNGLDSKTLFEALSANYNAFVEAGATDTTKQIQFVSTILSAEASKGIDGQRALRDSIDLLQGRFNNLVFAKEIGVTADEFKRAADNGTQLDYILSHLTGYAAGISDNANSFRGLATSVGELVHQLEGQTFAPVFQELSAELRTLKTELQDPAVGDGLRAIGFEVAEVVHSGASLLNFAIQNAGALSTLAQAGVGVGAALAAVKIGNLVTGLASLVLSSGAASTALAGTAEAAVAVEGAEAGAAVATGGLGAALTAAASNPATLWIAALAAIGVAVVKASADLDAMTAKMGEVGAGFDHARESNGTFAAQAVGTPEQFAAEKKRLEDQIAQLQQTIKDNTVEMDVGGDPSMGPQTVDISSGAQQQARANAEQMLSLTQNRLSELEKIRAGELDVSNIKKDQLSTEKALSDAEKDSLANIGAALDKANLADQDKATAAAAYQTALDQAIQKTAEQSGLSADVVANIRSSADFQAAANGLSERQQAILAGNLETIIAARNAADKANDALAKENDQLKSKAASLGDALGTINEKLQDQQGKLAEVKASTDVDKPQEIARIESNINALLDDQAKKRAELAKVTQQQADNANPAAAALRDAAQRTLSQPLDPDTSDADLEARANARAQAQAQLNLANQVLNGQLPPSALNQTTTGQAQDLADPDRTSLPLGTGTTTQGPLPGAVPPGGTGSISDFGQGAGDLGDASQSLGQTAQQSQQAASTLAGNASAVQTAFGQVQTGQSDYHDAVMDGINGLTQNQDSLTQAMQGQNQTISQLSDAIAQLQLQIDNVASSIT